jgi:hypothetical protein
MYNIAATVAGALLAGGAVLYAGYAYVDSRDEAAAELPRTAEAAGADQGGRGVPDGVEALAFQEGAPGERIARGEPGPEETALRGADERALNGQADDTGRRGDAPDYDGFIVGDGDEAMAEAERLAALGAGGVLGDEPQVASGLRGIEREAPGVRRDAPVTRPENLPPAPVGAPDSVGAAPASLADVPAASTPLATASEATPSRNPRLADKPDGSPFFTQNKRLTDKPDGAPFFTENKRLIDKPDDGQFFTENTTGSDFGPCIKADGTPYVGPGTATNPFAPSNPCLPQAAAQSFELAQALPVATASDIGQAVDTGFGVPLGQAFRGLAIPAPPGGTNFGSDYRTDG